MYFLFDFGRCSILSVKNRGLVTKVFVKIPLIKYLYSLRSNLKHFIHKNRTHTCDVHLKNVVFLIIPLNHSSLSYMKLKYQSNTFVLVGFGNYCITHKNHLDVLHQFLNHIPILMRRVF